MTALQSPAWPAIGPARVYLITHTTISEDSRVAPAVNLVVPIKQLAVAKSRLAGARQPDRHSDLVLAMALDTVAAAVATSGVDRVLIVASNPAEVETLTDLGAEVAADHGAGDLNAALRLGAEILRAADDGCVVGALQADLPALEPGELAAAIVEAAGQRAFCADRHETGTTLLLSAAGGALDPRFGTDSASSHLASGAVALTGSLTTLRSDVDTPADLEQVRVIGLGAYTGRALADHRRAC